MPLEESRGFSFDLNLFRDRLSDRTKMVILNSPQNPTGGVIPRGGHRGHRRNASRARRDGVERRDLFADLLRRERRSVDREFPRDAGEDHHPRRLLEDLCHDRLAHGLRRDAGVAGGRGEQADGEFELLHRQFHAARRHRRAHRTAGLRGRHGGGIPPPPRRHLRGAEPDSGFPLRGSGRRVLRVCQRDRHGHPLQGTGRLPAG
jgi:hypothetical protein